MEKRIAGHNTLLSLCLECVIAETLTVICSNKNDCYDRGRQPRRQEAARSEWDFASAIRAIGELT